MASPLPNFAFHPRVNRNARLSLGPCRSALALGAGLILLTGCQGSGGVQSQRLDQIDLKIQQLEERLNKIPVRGGDPSDGGGKPPAGPVKSLTLRTGTDDDRLRIYWSDGSSTDLPCTREQATYVCG